MIAELGGSVEKSGFRSPLLLSRVYFATTAPGPVQEAMGAGGKPIISPGHVGHTTPAGERPRVAPRARTMRVS